MSNWKPIEQLSDIDDDQCLDGYRAGHGFIPVDYTRNNASYWHGYDNALADRGIIPIPEASKRIANEMVGESRKQGMH